MPMWDRDTEGEAWSTRHMNMMTFQRRVIFARAYSMTACLLFEL